MSRVMQLCSRAVCLSSMRCGQSAIYPLTCPSPRYACKAPAEFLRAGQGGHLFSPTRFLACIIPACPCWCSCTCSRQVDLKAVGGTGPAGRITASDVERAAGRAPTVAAPAAAPAAAAPAPAAAAAAPGVYSYPA
eukprot:1153330-Pelagomonas_calceolata.AAC.5